MFGKYDTRVTAGAMLIALFVGGSSTHGQGSLTPPGAPVPTMKTLSQIEPRTPIASVPFTILNSGAYYLTTNVTVGGGNAISIGANDVWLDLNGFTISSTENPAKSGNGILIGSGGSAVTNVTILNGFIASDITNNGVVYSGIGFSNGISYAAQNYNVRVSGVSVRGCKANGIDLGSKNSIVESCTVNTAGSYGILAQTVSDSTATLSGVVCIYAAVVNNCHTSGQYGGIYAVSANNCLATMTGNSFGVSVQSANNCYGSSSSGDGIQAVNANNCYGTSTDGRGLSGTSANGCSGYSVSNTGLSVTSAMNCFGTSSTGTGLVATNAQNCTAQSISGVGMQINDVAIGCVGRSNTGTGLKGNILNSCTGYGITNYTYNFKYNMP